MLKKFLLGSVLVQAFIDKRSGPERLAASPLAQATTPDQLIVAHILHDYAKNPKGWKVAGTLPMPRDETKELNTNYNVDDYKRGDTRKWYKVSAALFRLYDGKVTVSVVTYVRNKDGDGIAPWFAKNFVEVNSVRLSSEAGEHFLTVLKTLIEKARHAEEVAEKARQAMEENERKWNLAESLLGMKRNEHGALVPKEMSCS